MSDLVGNPEDGFSHNEAHISPLSSSDWHLENFLNMSDAQKIENCSFPGITGISEKISRSCKQLTQAMYRLHIEY